MLINSPTQLRSDENHFQCALQQNAQGKFAIYRSSKGWNAGVTPKQAAVEAVQKIASRYPGEFVLPLSGGVDSEFLALSFMEAGISFNPVIMKFTDGWNDFDTKDAFRFCKKHGLSPTTLELNLDDFFKSEKHLFYAETYRCRSPQLATHLWMIEQIEGAFIFPYNPLPLFNSSIRKLYIAFPPPLYHCYDLMFDKLNRAGVGSFHTYTNELIYSFFQLPLYLETLFNSEKFFKTYSPENYFIKCELYKSGGYPIEARYSKATGFENYRKHLNQKYQISNGIDYFDSHFRRPMEQLSQDDIYQAFGEVDLERLFSIWKLNA